MLGKRDYAYRERELPKSLLLILKPKALYFRSQSVCTDSRVL
jgi:hypothetical protein